MNSDLFVEFAAEVFEDMNDLLLYGMGVVRERTAGDDEPDERPAMQASLQEADRMHKIFDDTFQPLEARRKACGL